MKDLRFSLQANKLAYHKFMDADRHIEVPRSKIMDYVIHSNSNGQRGSTFFYQFPNASSQEVIQKGRSGACSCDGLCYKKGAPSLEKLNPVSWAISMLAPVPGGDTSLSSKAGSNVLFVLRTVSLPSKAIHFANTFEKII